MRRPRIHAGLVREGGLLFRFLHAQDFHRAANLLSPPSGEQLLHRLCGNEALLEMEAEPPGVGVRRDRGFVALEALHRPRGDLLEVPTLQEVDDTHADSYLATITAGPRQRELPQARRWSEAWLARLHADEEAVVHKPVLCQPRGIAAHEPDDLLALRFGNDQVRPGSSPLPGVVGVPLGCLQLATYLASAPEQHGDGDDLVPEELQRLVVVAALEVVHRQEGAAADRVAHGEEPAARLRVLKVQEDGAEQRRTSSHVLGVALGDLQEGLVVVVAQLLDDVLGADEAHEATAFRAVGSNDSKLQPSLAKSSGTPASLRNSESLVIEEGDLPASRANMGG
eukprot:CAMPEP_0175264490 /NCGR_PEP_ID=MMETSP0093-20121207/42334_1 /TAXON_ID=311494 /ORGANISM="Alexandrium monilatum, Strain CCMP3105" /LENGTH=338 /DNA_ID=CAMNT_0016559045 /DNA_START=111 /DNA_END=1128 /DNA_ORIENTATION=+